MADIAGRFRQRSVVHWSDPDFSVRIASVEDLVRIYHDSLENRWTARWSSEQALREQVSPDSTAILCPLLRNGGPESAPESYRCYIWFVVRAEDDVRAVSVIDIGKEMLSTLREASSPDQLKEVVRLVFEGSRLAEIS